MTDKKNDTTQQYKNIPLYTVDIALSKLGVLYMVHVKDNKVYCGRGLAHEIIYRYYANLFRLPEGHEVVFKDGNPLNVVNENLELVKINSE